RLLEEGAPARALSCLGRVLAEHPKDSDAEALLERAQAGAADEQAEEDERAAAAALLSDGPLDAASLHALPAPLYRRTGPMLLGATLVVVVATLIVVATLVDRTLPPEPETEAGAGSEKALPVGPQMTLATPKDRSSADEVVSDKPPPRGLQE